MTLDYLVAELQTQADAEEQEERLAEAEYQQCEHVGILGHSYPDDDPAAWQEETDKVIDYVRRENQRQHEERWAVREAAAERIRETVRRAESDPETWLQETLEADDDN